MSFADEFVPPEGFVQDNLFCADRVLSRRQKIRKKYSHQREKFTPFSCLPPRARRNLTVAQGWLIKSDPNGRGVFTSHNVLPGSREWPDPKGEGQVHWADLYILPGSRQPDGFFNVTLSTLAMVWAHALIAHVEGVIDARLTDADRRHGRLRSYYKKHSHGGGEMIFAPNRGVESLDGLTIHAAQTKWLREHWANLASLVPAVRESARLDPSYAYGVGLYLVTKEPTLSVDAVVRAVEVFHDHCDQDYEADCEDFETHRSTIEAMLKGRIWQWEASEARTRGEDVPPDPSDEVLRVIGHESNAIRL